MTENERKKMMNLADTIKGEINRICVTKDITELDTMKQHAQKNLDKLWDIKWWDLVYGKYDAKDINVPTKLDDFDRSGGEWR